MSETKLQLFLNQSSGEIYEVEQDEIDNMDKFQLPLTARPSTSCKKCYGRGWIGRAVPSGNYILCIKCLKKVIDYKLLAEMAKKFKDD